MTLISQVAERLSDMYRIGEYPPQGLVHSWHSVSVGFLLSAAPPLHRVYFLYDIGLRWGCDLTWHSIQLTFMHAVGWEGKKTIILFD